MTKVSEHRQPLLTDVSNRVPPHDLRCLSIIRLHQGMEVSILGDVSLNVAKKPVYLVPWIRSF